MANNQTITRAVAWEALVGSMLNPIVSVKSPNGGLVQCDLRKVPADVGIEFIPGFVSKRLSDISANSTKGGTANDVHDQRRKVVKTWYDGDLTMKGGGTPDPVGQQMKEEIISYYIGLGFSRAEAQKHVKGTAIAFLTTQAADQPEAERNEWLKGMVDHFRAAAEKTLAERQKAEKKVEIGKIKIALPTTK